MEPAGFPGIFASPSAPLPWRPGYCTYVPGITQLDNGGTLPVCHVMYCWSRCWKSTRSVTTLL